ncbi:MAG: phosphopantetheine adenylyltransferase [Pseudomonadota bacterium]
MDTVRSVLLLIPGVIHLLPISGVLGGPRLSALYGIGIADTNLLILMQHRAVVLGLLGVLLIMAAFRASLQLLAILAGLISTISFIVLVLWTGGYNESIQRVLYADVLAVVCLLVAAITLYLSSTTQPGRSQGAR